MSLLSSMAIPLFISLVILCGQIKGVKVYDAFVEGGKEGILTVFKIVPYLIAMSVAISVFQASGAMELLAYVVDPILKPLGVPSELLPLMIVRPLSGSASLGVLASLLTRFGPDSYIGKVASTMMGSTETTFYVLTIYLGAVGIKKSRHALPAALMADITAYIMAVIIICLILK